MSAYPEGPDWWVASDGRWYPGYLHPDARTATAGATQTPPWDPSWSPNTTPPSFGAAGQWSAPYTPSPPAKNRRNGWIAGLAAIFVLAVIAVYTLVTIPVVRSLRRSVASPSVPTVTVPQNGFVGPVPAVTDRAPVTLTTALATAVVREVWPTFAHASDAGQTTQLAKLATPDVIDAARAMEICGCRFGSTDYSTLEITSVPQSSYPLSFLAEMDPTKDSSLPNVTLVAFSKQSPGAPWLIEHVVIYGGTHPELATGASLAPPGALGAPGSSAFVQLANMFVSLRDHGVPAAANLWDDTVGGPSGDQPTATETDLRQQYADDVAAGFQESANLYPTDYSPQFWTGSTGIQCASITGQVVLTPNPGHKIVQRASRQDFGALLAPGTYSTVTEQYALQVCLDRPSASRVDVVGLNGGEYEITGTLEP